MRQTEMDKVPSNSAGRSSERPVSFPDILFYRGRAGDGADCLAALDRQLVVLSRPLAGLPCRIRISTRQFSAVAVVSRGEGHVVQLLHRESGLTFDVLETSTLQDAEERCDALADFLDLPTMVMGGLGPAGEEPARLPRLTQPTERRTRLARSRRPRFLTRRRKGEPNGAHKLEGEEIIARS